MNGLLVAAAALFDGEYPELENDEYDPEFVEYPAGLEYPE